MVVSEANDIPIGAYPSEWEFDGLLTDGTAVCVRPIQPSDVGLLLSFHARLSTETIDSRYSGYRRDLTRDDAARLAKVDYRGRMGFVAVVAEQLVGFASYDRILGEPAAEIAFVVADQVQHFGVGTLLFESLAAYGRTVGIARFVADVMADNVDMLEVFGAIGLESRRTDKSGMVRVDIELQPTSDYVARCDKREATAEVASVSAFLRPRSIAVVGAGRTPGNAGHEIVRSLLTGEFTGVVYPVNPRASSICGVPAFKSLSSLPRTVDLAIIAVPSTGVRDIVGEAATLGVRSVVIVTAGFGETDSSGKTIEEEMLGIARRHGMRIVGPNSLGVVNTDPTIRMDASFAELGLAPGRLALVSQSGALGVALARQAKVAGVGFSSLVSMGDKLDVSSNDLLCFFERDEGTSVIALYLESFGNPRKFARFARRVGMQKPIVALTAGGTRSDARGDRSHTAAAATPDVVVTALLDGSGVIKVNHLDQLVDVSSVLLTGKLPKGSGVALVGNSCGPLTLATDACREYGLSVPTLGDSTRAALLQLAGSSAVTANPIDLTADGDAATLEQALAITAADEQIDSVIVVVTDLPACSAADARSAIARFAASATKPVIACVLGSDETSVHGHDAPFATLPSPERATSALAHVVRYARWRRQPREDMERPARAVAVDDAVTTALERHPDGGWLDLDEAAGVLEACGLALLPTRAATSAAEAIDVAEHIGFPVALKARAGAIVHKSAAGGVVVGLESARAVGDAYEEMAGRLGAAMGGAVVQPMAPTGVEAIVGICADPRFGPVVMVGLGGVTTDLLADRAFATPPFEVGQAEALVASLRSAPLLDGYRGTPRVDRAALVRLVELVADIADEIPELAELDCNPVLVGSTGAVVVDCRARLMPAQPGPGPLFRALRARRS